MAVDTSREAVDRLALRMEGIARQTTVYASLDRAHAGDAAATLRDLLARAEAAEGRCDLFDTQAAAAKIMAANAEAQRDAALAERDRLAEALGFYACECAAHGDDCDGQHDAMYCGWRAKAALAPIKKEPTDGE